MMEVTRLKREDLLNLKSSNYGDQKLIVQFPDVSLGLKLVEVSDVGVIVADVEGLPNRNLPVASRISHIGNICCVGLGLEDVMGMIKRMPRPLNITFNVPKTLESQEGWSQGGRETEAAKVANKQLTMRLRNLSATRQDSSGALFGTQQDAGDNLVEVTFRDGPLGIKITQIDSRVFVSSFENEPDGKMGQAEASGLIHFGYQLVKIGKTPCEDKNMVEIGALVQKQKRPMVLSFRKLYERRKPRTYDSSDNIYMACTCGGVRECNSSNPLYLHFRILWQSVKVKIRLEYEDNADIDFEELPDPNINALFLHALDCAIDFTQMPTWLQKKIIEWRIHYTDDAKRNTDFIPPSKPSLKTTSMADCFFCSEQQTINERAEQLGDDMFIHFYYVFQTFKSREVRLHVDDKQAYNDYLNEIDLVELYRTCQAEGISLHRWAEWIKTYCSNAYEENLYKVSLGGDTEFDLREILQGADDLNV